MEVTDSGDNNELTLTTHRVRLEGKRWGRGQVTSIMLESLTSCEITYATHPFLLVIAGIFAVYMLIQMNEISAAVFLVGMAFAGVFVVAYHLTREQVICLKSPSASIKVDTDEMSLESAKRFIDTAEKAKSDRLKS
jgi:hypothetical protein